MCARVCEGEVVCEGGTTDSSSTAFTVLSAPTPQTTSWATPGSRSVCREALGPCAPPCSRTTTPSCSRTPASDRMVWPSDIRTRLYMRMPHSLIYVS